jgi:acetyl-CoA acetyltransferase
MSGWNPTGTAIAGIGVRQYKRGGAPMPEMGVLLATICDAASDAGIDPADIDGFVTYGGDDKNEPTRLMQDLGTRDMTLAAQVFGGGGGGIAAAFGLATGAIQSGQAQVVAIFRTLVQGNSGRLSGAVMAHHLNDYLMGSGLTAPAVECAMRAQRMMEARGVPERCAVDLVRASYFHGSRNPKAVAYGKDIDVESYYASRIIAEPFHLFDCSRENDGAGVLIMTSGERARDLKQQPIYLRGVASGAGKGWGDLCQNDNPYDSAGFVPIAKRLFAQTGLSAKDIDVVQLYENFSHQGLASPIDHGFCTYENIGEVITFENLIAPSGKLPVNTGGGNLAQGFIHGMGMAIEAVEVLRGTSSNPVPGAKNCLLAGGPAAPLVSSAIFSTEG